ncbi:uncharacterized protein LAESUDRAFT_726338 [Laetiporus sulphureus 93-53]|uniref:Nucleoporin Nup159/Nup146 N-terminal domain-containing protein n=1 Tax=Laetiporus sulphureus 93-53 TaxID=1314785 RepID=A0A165E2E5_9APHY|nr:uncharacterized protein LAESUDRAFT_726338 [Laetiporus sulphureus 93-53]KZT06115.1 hypothetical protein LAESUDRAFT_726338 [Laetiporus sulphureus 93-53]
MALPLTEDSVHSLVLTPPPPLPSDIKRYKREALERDTDFLALRLLNKRVRVKLSPEVVGVEGLQGRANLFAIANHRGIFAAVVRASSSEFHIVVSPLADLRTAFASESSDDIPFAPRKRFPLTGFPSIIKFANNESRLLITFNDGTLAVYDVGALIEDGPATPLHTFPSVNNLIILQVEPNLGEHPELVAVLRDFRKSEENHHVAELYDVQALKPRGGWVRGRTPRERPTSVFWSPTGKEVALGLESGEITAYDPTKVYVMTAVVPRAGDTAQAVLGAKWLSKTELFAAYTPSPISVENSQAHFGITLDLEEKKFTTTSFLPLYLPFPGLRPPATIMPMLRDWDPAKYLIFVTDACTTDISLISNINDYWFKQELEESSTPTVPLDEELNETVLLGMEFDLTDNAPYQFIGASEEVTELPPSPILYAYVTDGTIIGWHVVNTKGFPYPGMVHMASQPIQPQESQMPAAPPPAVMATGAILPPPEPSPIEVESPATTIAATATSFQAPQPVPPTPASPVDDVMASEADNGLLSLSLGETGAAQDASKERPSMFGNFPTAASGDAGQSSPAGFSGDNMKPVSGFAAFGGSFGAFGSSVPSSTPTLSSLNEAKTQGFGQSAFGQPSSFGKSFFAPPASGHAAFGQPTSSQSALSQPITTQPGFGASGFGASGFVSSGFVSSGFAASGFGSSSFGKPPSTSQPAASSSGSGFAAFAETSPATLNFGTTTDTKPAWTATPSSDNQEMEVSAKEQPQPASSGGQTSDLFSFRGSSQQAATTFSQSLFGEQPPSSPQPAVLSDSSNNAFTAFASSGTATFGSASSSTEPKSALTMAASSTDISATIKEPPKFSFSFGEPPKPSASTESSKAFSTFAATIKPPTLNEPSKPSFSFGQAAKSTTPNESAQPATAAFGQISFGQPPSFASPSAVGSGSAFAAFAQASPSTLGPVPSKPETKPVWATTSSGPAVKTEAEAKEPSKPVVDGEQAIKAAPALMPSSQPAQESVQAGTSSYSAPEPGAFGQLKTTPYGFGKIDTGFGGFGTPISASSPFFKAAKGMEGSQLATGIQSAFSPTSIPGSSTSAFANLNAGTKSDAIRGLSPASPKFVTASVRRPLPRKSYEEMIRESDAEHGWAASEEKGEEEQEASEDESSSFLSESSSEELGSGSEEEELAEPRPDIKEVPSTSPASAEHVVESTAARSDAEKSASLSSGIPSPAGQEKAQSSPVAASSTTPPGSPSGMTSTPSAAQMPPPPVAPYVSQAFSFGRPSTRPVRSSPLASQSVTSDVDHKAERTAKPELAPSPFSLSTLQDSLAKATPESKPPHIPEFKIPPFPSSSVKMPPLPSPNFSFARPANAPTLTSQSKPPSFFSLVSPSPSGAASASGSMLSPKPATETALLGTRPVSALPQTRPASPFAPLPAASPLVPLPVPPAPFNLASGLKIPQVSSGAPGFKAPALQPSQPSGVSEQVKAAQNLQNECLNLHEVLTKEFEKVQFAAQDARNRCATLYRAHGGRHVVSDLGDSSKWAIGDSAQLEQIVRSVQHDLAILKEEKLACIAAIEQVEGSMLKASTRREEIAQFSEASRDPDFARMLESRTLGPEHLETQKQLRRDIRVLRDRVQQLEGQIHESKKKLDLFKSRKTGLHAPSLDTINRIYRNIDQAIQQQEDGVAELTARTAQLNLKLAQEASPTDYRLSWEKSSRRRELTPTVARSTAAALNAEMSAHKLKRALSMARKEPLLNDQAVSKPMTIQPRASLAQKPESMEPSLSNLNSSFTEVADDPFASDDSSELSHSAGPGHRLRVISKRHAKAIPLKKAPSSSPPAAKFDWGPLPGVKPMQSLPVDLRERGTPASDSGPSLSSSWVMEGFGERK